MIDEVSDMARVAREQARQLESITSIAVRLGASTQIADRQLSEELYAAMGLK